MPLVVLDKVLDITQGLHICCQSAQLQSALAFLYDMISLCTDMPYLLLFLEADFCNKDAHCTS